MTTRRSDCVKSAQLYRVSSARTLQRTAAQQVTEQEGGQKQRRSGWMKVRKGEVEVRNMAVASTRTSE